MIAEYTGEPSGDIQSSENQDNLALPDNKNLDFESLLSHKRDEKPIGGNDSSKKISAFLPSLSRPSDDSLSFPEYLIVLHGLNQIKKDENIEIDRQVNL